MSSALLVDRIAAGRREQLRQRRAAAHGVDDQVGGAAARRRRCARRVTCTRPPIRRVSSALDGHAAPELDARLVGGGAADRLLERAAAAGPGHEALVAGARRAVGDRRRHRVQRVEAQRAGVRERLADVGQLGVEHLAPERLQVVRLAELRDAVAAPALPGGLGVGGERIRVALEDGHAVCRPEPASSRWSGRRGRRRARSCGPFALHDVSRRRSIPRDDVEPLARGTSSSTNRYAPPVPDGDALGRAAARATARVDGAARPNSSVRPPSCMESRELLSPCRHAPVRSAP